MKNGKLLRRIILSSTSLVIISASSAWSASDTISQTTASWNRQEYDVTNNATDPLELEIDRDAETYINIGLSSLTDVQVVGPTPSDITGFDVEVIATLDQSILDGDELVVIDDSASSDFYELSAAIIVDEDALQRNIGNIFQSSTQDFTSDADIVAGDVSQYGAANQSAQFGSEILVDSEGTYEVTAGVINDAVRYAGNELVFSLYAAQSSAAGGNVVAGNVRQKIDVTQSAQIGSEIELVSSSDGVIEAAILNFEGTETLNLSEGNVVSLQQNNAADSVRSGNVVQAIAVDQSGEILNDIILVSSDAAYVYGNILNYGESYAANFAANEFYSGQVNQNDGDIEVDVVDQSSTIAQTSGIRNEITIEAGSEAGIYAAIGSGGENYAINMAGVSIEAGQENSSLGNVVAGDTDQSLLTEQAATIWNGITIETNEYSAAYAQLENMDVNWAYNIAGGNGLAAVQENQGLDVEAGDVDQSLSIEQSVIIWNGIAIEANEPAQLYVGIYNFNGGVNYAVNRHQEGNVVADQANLGNDVEAGDVNQDLSIDQEAVFWNGITINAAAGGEMFVIIGNDGSNYAGSFADGNLIALQANEAAGNVDAGDVSQSFLSEQASGIYSEIVVSAGDDSFIQAGIFNGGNIGTGNYAYSVAASIQENAGGYRVSGGNVDQSDSIQQSAAVYNEITVDGDKGVFAYLEIDNEAEIFAVNYAESILSSSQSNGGDFIAYGGDVVQSSSLDQASIASNAIDISSDEVATYSAIWNKGTTHVQNVAENILESDQSNGGYFAAVAGDVEQTFEIDQFAGISNEIAIATNDDAFGWVGIVNYGPLESENASVVVLSSVQENEALGFGIGGNVGQSISVDQVAGLWNEVGIDSGNIAVSVPAVIANVNNVDVSNFSVANLVAVAGNDAFYGLNGNVDQSRLLSQVAGVWNELDVTGQNAGGVLFIANGGDLYARNDSVEGFTSDQTMVGEGSSYAPFAPFDPFSTSVDQASVVDQLAGIWNAVRVHAQEAVSIDAEILNDGGLRAENTSTGTLGAGQSNGALFAVAGNVSQAATLDQTAGIWNAVELDGGDSVEALPAIRNEGGLRTSNSGEVTETAARDNIGNIYGVGGIVDQSIALDQFAGSWNGIEIDSGFDTAAEAVIYNTGEIYSLNTGAVSLASDQENSGGFAGGAYGVEQSASADQLSGTWNVIDISSGGETYAAARISNLGPITSENINSLSLSSGQTSAGGIFAISGNVNQSASVNQVGGVWNGIDIEGGDGTSAEAIIVNDDLLGITNASSLYITSGQETIGGNMASGGSVSQSASVEQVAGIWNEITIDNDGGDGSSQYGISAVIVNSGDLSVYNESSLVLASAQLNLADHIVAGNVDQSVEVVQTAVIWNGIGIGNDGEIDASGDGIAATITNSGNLSAYNTASVSIDSDILNGAAPGNVSLGDVNQGGSAVLDSSIWNVIGIANTGTINADGDGMVATIDNSGNLALASGITTDVSSGQSYVPADSLVETELSGGIYNIISLSNANSIWVGGVGMSGRIIGNDTSGNIDISNSGRVVSESGRAIEFEGGSRRTLDLFAPAFIGGTMDLGGSANVNITTGRSHSVLWTFDGELEGGAPNASGKVPYFYNPDTKTFATIDPTVFAAAYSMLTNMTGMLSGVVQRRVDGGGAGAGQVASLSNPNTYATVLEKAPGEEASAIAVPTADVPAAEPGSALWMAVTGGTADEDGNDVLNPIDSRYVSVTAGYDWRYNGDDLFGVMGGYIYGKSTVDSTWVESYSSESEGVFAGLYGRYHMETLFLDYALTGGMLWNNDTRYVNDNLAPLGEGNADADYGSLWLSPEVGMGMQIAMPHDAELIPSVRLRYAGQWFDSYSEDGSRANAEVDSRSIGVGEARAELAARQYVYFGSLTGRVGVLGRTQFGGEDANVTMIGQGEAIPAFTEDYLAGYAGLDLTMRPTEGTRINFAGQATFGDFVTSYEGTAQFTFEF